VTNSKQKVTLTLDPEIYRRFRTMAERIPGKVSLSALVDQQLAWMLRVVEPLMDQLEAEPDRAKQYGMIRAFFGGTLLETAADIEARIRVQEVDTER